MTERQVAYRGSTVDDELTLAPRCRGRRLRRGQRRKAPGSGLFSTPSCPGSIVSAEAFHFRVRDGNGWFRLAPATRSLVRLRRPGAGGFEASSSRPHLRWVAGVGLEPTTSGL